MNWKPNKRTWYSLGLALLLCIGFLTLATGPAYARYRSERQAKITFQIRQQDILCLGTVAEDNTFSTTAPAWETVKGVPQMELAVANGTSAEDVSGRDQGFHFRMIATAGMEKTSQLYLQLPGETGEDSKISATVTPITEGTALYHTVGAGWIYTFLDADGQELAWELPGGQWEYMTLKVTLENAAQVTDVLLQPMAVVAD